MGNSDRYGLAMHVTGVSDSYTPSSDENKGNLYITSDPFDDYSSVEWDLPDFWTSNSSDTFNVKPATLRDNISALDTSVDPVNSDISFSSINFTLDATDALVGTFRATSRLSGSQLDAELQRSDNDVQIKGFGVSDEGSIVYIGNETIYLRNHKSGNKFDVNRGLFLSDRHYAGANTNVYVQNIPNWNKRRIVLFEYDLATDPIKMTQLYLGYIDGTPDHNTADIVIRSQEQLSQAFDSFVNFGPTTSGIVGDSNIKKNVVQRTENEIKLEIDIESSNVYNEADYNQNPRGVVQISDFPIVHYEGFLDNEAAALYRIDWTDYVSSIQDDLIAPALSREYITRFPFSRYPGPDNFSDVERSQIQEIFLIDRELDQSELTKQNVDWGSGTNSVVEGKFSATRAYNSPVANSPKGQEWIYHPLAIIAAFLFSSPSSIIDTDTFDVLDENWSLNVRHLANERTYKNIRELIDQTIDLQIDHLALGWNAEKVDIWGVIQGLLHTWGFQIGVDDNGLLNFSRLTNPDIFFLDSAHGNKLEVEPSETLQVNDGEDTRIDQLSGRLGNLPYAEGKEVKIAGSDGQLGSKALRSKPDESLNMESISVTNEAKGLRKIRNRLFENQFRIPRLRVQVKNSQDKSIGLGDNASFEIPTFQDWLVNTAGERVKFSSGSVAHAGKIISRKLDPQTRSAIVDLYLYAIYDSVARLRSPSGVITDYDSGAQTISFDTSGQLAQDVSEFSVGDEVQLFQKDGKLRDSTVNEVTSLLTTGGQVDGIELDGWEWSPRVDDVIAFSFYDTDDSGAGYKNDPSTTQNLDNVGRVWTLLGSPTGSGDEDLDRDIYGSN